MKLTKLLLLSAGMLSVSALASCGTKDEKAALEKVMKGTIITENATGAPVVSGTPSELDGFKNTCLDLTTVQIKNKKNVKITWEVVSNKDKVKSQAKLDDNHDRLKFNYGSHAEGHDDQYETTEVELKATGKCGGAKLTKNYKVVLKHNKNIYDALSLEEFYAAEGDRYAIQDEDYGLPGNHGQQYNYVKVSGKLEYMSPDGNWGLLSDGDHVVELYQLTKSTDYAMCEVGKYLDVYGSVSQYKGNLQVQYCNFIEEMSDHSRIQAMTEYGEMPEDMNTSVAFNSGVMSRIATLSNVEVLKFFDKNNNEKAATDFDAGDRFVIQVQKGAKKFNIAYDYHAAKGDDTLTAAFNSFIKGLSAGDHINVKGTIRYNIDGDLAKPGGEYQLTPYFAEHLSK
ncbi:MAG: hypothetical protein K6E11_02355 [Bacilli bacterium]|nr:hypothetical protein [Bacilli bacterium]